MYDQRLFNQDAGGAGAGMGGEDSYNIYDKPLFADRAELFKHTVGWAGRRGAAVLVVATLGRCAGALASLGLCLGVETGAIQRPAVSDNAACFLVLAPSCLQGRQDAEVYAGAGGGGGGGEGGEGDVNTARFKPDKGFSGADYGKGGEGGAVQVRRGASGAGAPAPVLRVPPAACLVIICCLWPASAQRSAPNCAFPPSLNPSLACLRLRLLLPAV